MKRILISLITLFFVIQGCSCGHKHNIVIDSKVYPTCLEDGLTYGSHCLSCGEVLLEQSVIPATGHRIVTDSAVAPTCTTDGLTEGSHCLYCGEVVAAQTKIDPYGHTEVKDEAFLPEGDNPGRTEGSHCSTCNEAVNSYEYYFYPEKEDDSYFITTEYTVIEDERFVLKIDANVYVPKSIKSDIYAVMDAIEEVTGLSFYPDCLDATYPDAQDKRVVINVVKKETGEFHNAYSTVEGVYISSGDLLICAGESMAIIHELTHVVNWRNGSIMSGVLAEGFSTYFTCKVIEKQYFPSDFNSYSNYRLDDTITSDNAESLMEEADSDGWFGYKYGFRLMHYIMEIYGIDSYMELSKRVFEEIGNLYDTNVHMIPRLKEYFGDDFFTEFGNWYKENESGFNPNYHTVFVNQAVNFSGLTDYGCFNSIDVFPYYGSSCTYSIGSFDYKERLIMNFSRGHEYTKQYMDDKIAEECSVRIISCGNATVYFFDKQGKQISYIKLEARTIQTCTVKGIYKIMVEGDGEWISIHINELLVTDTE